MPYRITIEDLSLTNDPKMPVGSIDRAAPAKVYEQTVDDIDLPRIIAAINTKKRVYTKRQPKAQP